MLFFLIFLGVGRLQSFTPIRAFHFLAFLYELTRFAWLLYYVVVLYLLEFLIPLRFHFLEVHLSDQLRGVESRRHEQRFLIINF